MHWSTYAREEIVNGDSGPSDPEKQQLGQGPIGEGDYVVEQGDCIESIAFKMGLFWETIWEDPHNAELRRIRKNPNVLLPGDRVFVPAKRQKEVSLAVDQKHRFRLKGVPSVLQIRLLTDNEPRANEPFRVEIIEAEEIDSGLVSGPAGPAPAGRTDEHGNLSIRVQPNWRKLRLRVGDTEDEYILDLGCVDPPDEVTGVQARLNDLGFDCGPEDGELGPRTRAALEAFQEEQGLDVTGEPDEATRDKLRTIFGC
jgi:hypothetical protein